jgi:hypothetical protein
VKIKGLDELTKKLRDLEKATAAVDGLHLNFSFDPADPSDIETAIARADAEIDARLAPYSRNDLVGKLAETMRERCREKILDQAAAARLAKGKPGE